MRTGVGACYSFQMNAAPKTGEVHTPQRICGLDRQGLCGAEAVRIAGEGGHHVLFLVSSRVLEIGRRQLGVAADDPALASGTFTLTNSCPFRSIAFPDSDGPCARALRVCHGTRL